MTIPGPSRGMYEVQHAVADTLRNRLPSYLDWCRTQWGLDTDRLLPPVKVLPYAGQIFDEWPMIEVQVQRMPNMTMVDYSEVETDPEYEATYDVEVGIHLLVQDFDRASDEQGLYTAAVRYCLLDNVTLDAPAPAILTLVAETVAEVYTPVDASRGDRFNPKSGVTFQVKSLETISLFRGAVATVDTTEVVGRVTEDPGAPLA